MGENARCSSTSTTKTTRGLIRLIGAYECELDSAHGLVGLVDFIGALCDGMSHLRLLLCTKHPAITIHHDTHAGRSHRISGRGSASRDTNFAHEGALEVDVARGLARVITHKAGPWIMTSKGRPLELPRCARPACERD